MSQNSARLALPYLQPAQAQKHVTHNEALRRLDTLTQLVVEAFGATTPPANPAQGEIHALGAAPVSAWAGRAGHLAQWADGAWTFLAPQDGWRAWGKAEGELRVWLAGAWEAVPPDTQNLDGVGVNTSWDNVNRLAVASDASLFSHAGSGHQVKLNKAATGDTATLLFQSGWSGRAEIGLAGEDALSFKVSADGLAWYESIRMDPAAGSIELAPQGTVRAVLGDTGLVLDVPLSGTAVQAGATDTTAGRLMLAQHGVLRSSILGSVSQSAGQPTGALIERGSGANGEYVRWADGTQICTSPVFTVNCATAEGSLFRSADGSWTYPAAFAAVTGGSGHCNNGTAVWVQGQFGGTTCAYAARAATSRSGDSVRLMAIGRWF